MEDAGAFWGGKVERGRGSPLLSLLPSPPGGGVLFVSLGLPVVHIFMNL